MQVLISLSFSLVGGLLMSRLAKKLNLPAVTAYLVAGLLLGPYCIGRLNLLGVGFHTPEEVSALDIISQTALGFIAFTIGNEFRLEQLKHMGKQAITVGIAQAVFTAAMVDVALVVLHFINPNLISISSAITLGAIAAATAPAATLMVVRQYKADGPLTKLLLLVVAIDDAVGLVLFSASSVRRPPRTPPWTAPLSAARSRWKWTDACCGRKSTSLPGTAPIRQRRPGPGTARSPPGAPPARSSG